MLQNIGRKAFKFRPVICFKTWPESAIFSGCGNTEGCSPQARNYSYFKSRVEESPDKYTQYEKSFEEWKFVEKLIPPKYVPEPPKDPTLELPSGWRSANPSKDCSYNIRRTKNHMIPVYCNIMAKGMVRFTHIRRVEGNIWQLEKDIGQWLQDRYPLKIINTRTHEVCRQIIIKGDLVDDVKEWVTAQGF